MLDHDGHVEILSRVFERVLAEFRIIIDGPMTGGRQGQEEGLGVSDPFGARSRCSIQQLKPELPLAAIVAQQLGTTPPGELDKLVSYDADLSRPAPDSGRCSAVGDELFQFLRGNSSASVQKVPDTDLTIKVLWKLFSRNTSSSNDRGILRGKRRI
jgi:hypothetical protein